MGVDPELQTNQRFEFRYLVNGETWVNEPKADDYDKRLWSDEFCGASMNATPEPAVIVIFGASGDLTQRAVPALHSLACSGLLHPAIGAGVAAP